MRKLRILSSTRGLGLFGYPPSESRTGALRKRNAVRNKSVGYLSRWREGRGGYDDDYDNISY